MTIDRVIITGTNGAGKSRFAQHLAERRPDLPMISYDALRLTTGWIKKPADQIARAVVEITNQKKWVLEGGPSLLPHALEKCQAVIWLDPHGAVRAWRLVARPWRNFGRVRAELPAGNVDWPWQQYRFALRSLAHGARTKAAIEASLRTHPPQMIRRCRGQKDVEAALDTLG